MKAPDELHRLATMLRAAQGGPPAGADARAFRIADRLDDIAMWLAEMGEAVRSKHPRPPPPPGDVVDLAEFLEQGAAARAARGRAA